jgi:hypothetical protein
VERSSGDKLNTVKTIAHPVNIKSSEYNPVGQAGIDDDPVC